MEQKNDQKQSSIKKIELLHSGNSITKLETLEELNNYEYSVLPNKQADKLRILFDDDRQFDICQGGYYRNWGGYVNVEVDIPVYCHTVQRFVKDYILLPSSVLMVGSSIDQIIKVLNHKEVSVEKVQVGYENENRYEYSFSNGVKYQLKHMGFDYDYFEYEKFIDSFDSGPTWWNRLDNWGEFWYEFNSYVDVPRHKLPYCDMSKELEFMELIKDLYWMSDKEIIKKHDLSDFAFVSLVP